MIQVTNDGKALTMEKINNSTYILESIFGEEHLNSDYYKIGKSVKIANIFSKTFFVETGSQSLKQAIKLSWKNNML